MTTAIDCTAWNTPVIPVLPLTPENLQAKCREWQKRLRLQDWDVYLEIARMSDLGVGTLGDCQPTQTKRHAKIRILNENDVSGHGFWASETTNWEVTLVHELLHLHFHDIGLKWGDGGAQDVAGERAIHVLSMALVFGTAHPDRE